MVESENGMAVEKSQSSMFIVQRAPALGMKRQYLEFSCNQHIRAKRVYIIVVLLSFYASPMPGGVHNSDIFWCVVIRLLSVCSFLHLQFSLNEPFLGPIRPVCFCIPQFWFHLAGGLDVVDRLYLKRALVIARSVRWLCSWQMGMWILKVFWTSTYFSSWVLSTASFLFSISEFKKNCLALYIFFEPTTKSRLWLGSLPPLPYPAHYIFHGIKKILKMLVQAGMNGCQQFLQTC